MTTYRIGAGALLRLAALASDPDEALAILREAEPDAGPEAADASTGHMDDADLAALAQDIVLGGIAPADAADKPAKPE